MNVKDIFTSNNLAIQQTSYTCGPASLLNVLLLKGDSSHTESELAKLCDCKPKVGTSNANLVKAAKAIGLEVVEAKDQAAIEDIERHIDNGECVIACYHYAYSGEGHYAVVTEYDDEALYFRDCTSGFFRLKKKYFDKFWYGDESRRWLMAVK